MDGFEDENPFDIDSDRIQSETSSASKVYVSEPPSPSPYPDMQQKHDLGSPTQRARAVSSTGSGPLRSPQSNVKTEFCCARDRVLHSGDDVEILVREFGSL